MELHNSVITKTAISTTGSQENVQFPLTYDDLKDSFSTVWADTIDHPWKHELYNLEEFFWTEAELKGEYITWTAELQKIYIRMQNILAAVRKTIHFEWEVEKF